MKIEIRETNKHQFKHNDHFYVLETMPAFPNYNSSRASH